MFLIAFNCVFLRGDSQVSISSPDLSSDLQLSVEYQCLIINSSFQIQCNGV